MKSLPKKYTLQSKFLAKDFSSPPACWFSIILPLLLLLSSSVLLAQADTISQTPDSLLTNYYQNLNDSLNSTILQDTLVEADSTEKKKSGFGLEASVKYKSFEKIHYDIQNRKVFLYEDAAIEYDNIELEADYIEIDFLNNTVFAKGVPDSTGKMVGEPVFKESGQSYRSKEMSYNFDTKKGIISHVITKDGEGYLHGEKIKKMPDGRVNAWHGGYTTCDLDHPHFQFKFTRAQVIPDNKIVSGPAYMVIEGVPTPLFLPFGLFPNKAGQRSGIIIPGFGESASRGFFLERGGYYWGINDYMDFTITGDIYTSGSWALRPTFRYANRYKYSGNFDLNYAVNYLGDKDDPGVEANKDFSIRWTHSQDPKARPNSRFSANVNIVSSQFNQFNLTSTNAYLSNTFQSSISYQTNFNNSMFLSINGTHQQNTIDGSVNISLPTVTFNTKQFYPFRKQKQVGQPKWYENINMKYTMNTDNRINTQDSLLFKPGWEDDFKFGVKHAIPISSSIKILKFFNLTNSVNYSEKWYPYTTRQNWINDTLITETDTTLGYVQKDTLRRFTAAREFSYSASMSTRLYGMYQLKKGPITAVRHVMTPSVSFTLRPDFGSDYWGYWDEVQTDQEGDTKRYSIFESSLYGGPQDGRSGSIGLSLANNLEMKVRSKQDTINGTKKVVLIDNFSFSTAYDIAKDSLNWAPLSISGRTTLFKKLNITYRSSWNPYTVDSAGKTMNQYEYEVSKKLFRMENTSWNFSISYRLSANDLKKDKKKTGGGAPPPEDNQDILEKYTEQEINDVLDNPDQYINWNNAWSLSINYSLNLGNNPDYINYERIDNKKTSAHTLGITGDISITPKWKVNFRTGYDIVDSKFTYTSIDFYRDLHCWEMHFSWIPTGSRKSWTFGINVKASILKDLKYDRKKDFRDSYQ